MTTNNMTRRQVLTTTAAGVLAASATPGFAGVFSAPQNRLKIGVIGIGGRGTGAGVNALAADPDVEIHAIGDLFEERAKSGLAGLLEYGDKARVKVDDRIFTGFDAYKAVLASGVDCVILATPPGFRPKHFEAAIDAGKHVFMEKPVAVDGPGIRRVLAAAQKAKEKNLSVVAGTQRRYDYGYRETIKRIHDGAIGDVVSMSCYWNQGFLWSVPRQEGWSDVEWQLRNWLYFTYLSGDHIAEQHIHNIDVCNWVKRAHPVKAVGLGGRQVRTDAVYGHIFDHFAVEFEYADGTRMHSYSRQIDGCANRVSERIVGTKGVSNGANWIRTPEEWKYSGDQANPYDTEHAELYRAVKANTPVNDGFEVAYSTLSAIMGRMACYTGAEVTWEQALNSTEALMPDDLSFGPRLVAAIAVPGKTKLV